LPADSEKSFQKRTGGGSVAFITATDKPPPLDALFKTAFIETDQISLGLKAADQVRACTPIRFASFEQVELFIYFVISQHARS
jgi:hypothetical protein